MGGRRRDSGQNTVISSEFPPRGHVYFFAENVHPGGNSKVGGGSLKKKTSRGEKFQICVESSTTHGVLEYSTRVCTRLNILIA